MPTIILIIVVTRLLSKVILRQITRRRATNIRRLLFLLRTMLIFPPHLLMATIIRHRGTTLLKPHRQLYPLPWMTRRRVATLLVRRIIQTKCIQV